RGILRNGITFGSGEVGQAFRFDGVDDFVVFTQSPSLDVGLGNGLTLECWVNPFDVSVPRPLIEWNNPSGPVGANFWISTNALGGGPGSLWADFIDSNGASHQIGSAPGLLTVSNYQHVAVTYDKTSGFAALYHNGISIAVTNLGRFTPRTSQQLVFGRRQFGPGTGKTYRGLMDEVSLFNRALTPTELHATFASGSAGKCSSPGCVP